jgi:hypothetical protein
MGAVVSPVSFAYRQTNWSLLVLLFNGEVNACLVSCLQMQPLWLLSSLPFHWRRQHAALQCHRLRFGSIQSIPLIVETRFGSELQGNSLRGLVL